MQCGFCAPGMIMAAKWLLDRNPDPSRADVVDAISGNICRCTGYDSIINAVLSAAAEMRGAQDARSPTPHASPTSRLEPHMTPIRPSARSLDEYARQRWNT